MVYEKCDSSNNTFTKSNSSGDTLVKIPEGYYTFDDLKEYLKKLDVDISCQKNNRVVIFCKTHSLTLTTFGTQLGFEKGEVVVINTNVVSQHPARMTNNLKNIHIHCDLVDPHKVFAQYVNGLYYSSSLFFVLTIDTTQSLNGTYTEFDLDSVALPCTNYSGQEINFQVESGGGPDDYEIYMTLEIS